MDESFFFFFFREGRGGFFSFCHSKSKRNKEFWREIPLCRRLPRVWLNVFRHSLPPHAHGAAAARFIISFTASAFPVFICRLCCGDASRANANRTELEQTRRLCAANAGLDGGLLRGGASWRASYVAGGFLRPAAGILFFLIRWIKSVWVTKMIRMHI